MEMVVDLYLPAILYALGSVLLILLIVLTVKILQAMNKLNEILEDTYQKSQSLNGFFSIMDLITDKVSLLSDAVTERLTDAILNIFRKKAKKKAKNEEE